MTTMMPQKMDQGKSYTGFHYSKELTLLVGKNIHKDIPEGSRVEK